MLGFALVITLTGLTACKHGDDPMAPTITSLTPADGHIGVAGQNVVCSVSATGVGPLGYFWLVTSGGGTFSAATSATTNLTLGAAGSYVATVAVTDSGGTTTGTINFTVDDADITINSISPDGDWGLPAAAVEIAADADGVVTGAAWEFDDGTVETTSSMRAPTVHLKDPGTYTGRVTLSNAVTTTDPFEFTFTVVTPVAPVWTSQSLGPALAKPGIDPFINAVVCDSRLAVIHNAPSGLVFSRAQVASPDSASDWISYVLEADGRGYGPHALVSLGDRLALVYVTPVPETLSSYYLRVAISSTVDPASLSDWTFHDLSAGASDRTSRALAVVDGKLVLVEGDGLPNFWQADVAVPADVSDWTPHRMREYSDGDILINPTSVAVVGTHLAISWIGEGGVYLSLSSSLTPDDRADWTWTYLTAQFGGMRDGLTVTDGWDGKSVTGFSSESTGLALALATVKEPSSFDDFVTVFLGNAEELHRNLFLSQAHNRLALLSHNASTGELLLWRQVLVDPTAATAWESQQLIPDLLPETVATSLCTLGEEQMAVGYIDTLSGEARVLVSDGPY
ncbi:MAG: hypothetical protein ABI743_05350 [bacterium]